MSCQEAVYYLTKAVFTRCLNSACAAAPLRKVAFATIDPAVENLGLGVEPAHLWSSTHKMPGPVHAAGR